MLRRILVPSILVPSFVFALALVGHPDVAEALSPLFGSKKNIGTCRTAQFNGGPYTFGGAGSLTEGGLYTAPTDAVKPYPRTATLVKPSAPLQSSVTITVAPMFPEAPASALAAPDPGTTPGDFPHAVVASGSRAYMLWQTIPGVGNSGATLKLLRSDDAGAHWAVVSTIASVSAGYYIKGASIAIDPRDPDMVYSVEQNTVSGTAATGVVNYRVSFNGGRDWSTPTAILSGNSGDGNSPDVVSPSPGVAVVSAVVAQNANVGGNLGGSLLLWKLDSRGNVTAGQSWTNGLANATLTASFAATSETLAGSHSISLYDTGGRLGPHLAFGQGKVCYAATAHPINSGESGNYVRCSTTNGASWGSSLLASFAPSGWVTRARIAIDRRAGSTAMAIAYHKKRNANDDAGLSVVQVSRDGGASFGPETVLPDVPDPVSNNAPMGTSDDEPMFDSFGDLWLARTINGKQIDVYHSCGSTAAFQPHSVISLGGDAASNTMIGESSFGIFVGGDRKVAAGNTTIAPMLARVLAP